MMKARLVALAVAATLASAGFVHAAPVPLRHEPQAAPAPHGAPADVQQAVVQAASAIVLPSVPDHVPAAERALKTGSPLHTYLLSAGEYVLQVGTLSDQHAVPSRITDVPLPGAMWLFGSALLAFLGISSRRKL
ncbi:hypothetical protein JJB11_03545 [Ramlibacter ginsenosidimutans]|uniref:Ice-binding protein C-terminal domain-containing protein n=1 Tax=Ramlibacter ginsenosidimutans TaxID=502333 RepID=A0A934TQ66_9BURK|nr:hypothetical protein [Ramlibacter ginsenosidimutans]MBK6005155.1 hypothetical protein [Ramlibacter ginsenosidimutans]